MGSILPRIWSLSNLLVGPLLRLHVYAVKVFSYSEWKDTQKINKKLTEKKVGSLSHERQRSLRVFRRLSYKMHEVTKSAHMESCIALFIIPFGTCSV